MLSNLTSLINEYKQFTIEQQCAVGDDNIDVLTELIAKKEQILSEIRDILNAEKNITICEDLRAEVSEIFALEQENIKKLKLAQGNVKKEIDKIKLKQDAFKEYAKNTR